MKTKVGIRRRDRMSVHGSGFTNKVVAIDFDGKFVALLDGGSIPNGSDDEKIFEELVAKISSIELEV